MGPRLQPVLASAAAAILVAGVLRRLSRRGKSLDSQRAPLLVPLLPAAISTARDPVLIPAAPALPALVAAAPPALGVLWTVDTALPLLLPLLALLLSLACSEGHARLAVLVFGAAALYLQVRLVAASAASVLVTTAAVPTQAVLAAAPPAVPNPILNGTWIKNAARSDSLDAACAAMHLNGLIRTAVRFVRGMELSVSDTLFEIAVFSVVPWFKIRERYLLTGETAMFSRRDMRRGKHRANLSIQGNGNALLTVVWDVPFGGRGTDEFVVVSQDELLVHSILYLDGAIVRYDVVYDRKQ